MKSELICLTAFEIPKSTIFPIAHTAARATEPIRTMITSLAFRDNFNFQMRKPGYMANRISVMALHASIIMSMKSKRYDRRTYIPATTTKTCTILIPGGHCMCGRFPFDSAQAVWTNARMV